MQLMTMKKEVNSMSKLLKEIEDTKAIIFAIEYSLKWVDNQFDYDTYMEELAYRRLELEELRKCLIH